jgi:large subunit ribosomal protein L25
MSEVVTIAAHAREGAGKGPARATRNAGRVPAVIYGAKKAPKLISLDPRDIQRELRTGAFLATLYEIDVDGKKERVLPKDIQFHPVNDWPLHVDFYRVSARSTVTVGVAVEFLNEEESPGLSRGGLLNVVRHEIELSCRADSIPSEIEVDLTGLDIGDSVHISEVTLPEGVELTITDRDFTICTIAAPTVVQDEAAEEAAEAAEAEEGEEELEGEGEGEEEGEGEDEK